MGLVFEIVDKTGRKIYLSRERWTHITEPSSPHAYMILKSLIFANFSLLIQFCLHR